MKIANIVPPAYLDLIDDVERYHLVIADHVVANDTYAEFYNERSKRGDYVILDGAIHEQKEVGGTTSLEVMQEAWHRILPSIITLPDIKFGTGQDTVRRAMEAQRFYADAQIGPPYFAVPQGETWSEYVQCAIELAQVPGVGMIGVYEETDYVFDNRLSVYMRLRARLPFGTQFHFLGMTEHMGDLLQSEVIYSVKGVDSSKLFVWGLDEQSPRPGEVPPYHGRPKDFWTMEEALTTSQRTCVVENIDYWRHRVAGR